MKINKRLAAVALSSVMVLTLAGCTRTVTGNTESDEGLAAFNQIVKTYPDRKGYHEELKHWGFELPTGEKFEWSKDMSANEADMAMVMLADPLVSAGLDVEKLDENEWLYKPAAMEDMGKELPNLLIKPYDVSAEKQESKGSEDSFRRILKADNSLVKFDEEIEKYRLSIGEANEVQWTKKLGSDDEDMVFVLKAEPLIEAGLDIDKLEGTGWTFRPAGQDVLGENPDQIVKVFDIKE